MNIPAIRPTRLLPLFLLLLAAAVPATAAEDRFEKAYELSGVTKIRVQNVNGPVHIATWDKDYLKVVAVKKVRDGNADQILRETEIRVTKNGPTIEIETILPKRGRVLGLFNFTLHGRNAAEVSYDLLLPTGVSVDAETVNGRITAEKRTGALCLSTVNGAVRVEGHDAPLRVNTVNGSVDAAFAGDVRASELETVNGSVTVSCSKASSIRYDLQTVNGRIHSEFRDLVVEGKWGPKEAKGELNGGREHLAVETVNGEVRLQVAEPAVAKKD